LITPQLVTSHLVNFDTFPPNETLSFRWSLLSQQP